MAQGSEKWRRMAVRREIGNRVQEDAEPIKEKPPIAPYLIAHACFNCRRSFKRAPERDGSPIECPTCKGPLYEMGRSFRPPRRADVRQWQKVQTLYAHGFRFFSYRSFDCPPLPETLKAVTQFLRDNPNHPFKVGAPNWDLLPEGLEL